jgi:hypothetical protein
MLHTSFAHQSQVGWHMILRGFITCEWEAVAKILAPEGKWIDTISTIIMVIWKIWKEVLSNVTTLLHHYLDTPNKFKATLTF